MKRFQLYLILAALLTACGGGGGGQSGGAAPAISVTVPVTVPTLAVLPNAHGLYPDANQVFQTDDEAGIFPNVNGFARSYSAAGKIDSNGPFFKSFGNGRTCASCHKQQDGFSITTKSLQQLFVDTDGTDPVFQLLDGANSPQSAVSTLEERRTAYSMLLNRGVFRIGLKIPDTAEFELVNADDPYHYASANELSLYRRPLPSANLKFLADVMWDGRETATDSSSKDCALSICYATLDSDLGRQANNATKGHAQAQADLSKSDQDAIVVFEKTLFVAQQVDNAAGLLFAADGTGGALALSTEDFFFGLNDIFIGKHDAFSFKLFSTWINDTTAGNQGIVDARQSITRGQAIFNNRPITINRVIPGTESLGFTFLTCSQCHSVPNVGNMSQPHPFNIGIADANVRTADMPLYTLRNKKTGEIVETQDPGHAMTTGLWKDIGLFKAPALRGLSMRAPYFHDGSAKTIEEATAFYVKRFDINFSPQELADLNAFLKAL
jgi:cytochrome c peroxidase